MDLFEKEIPMAKTKKDDKNEEITCPIGRFFSDLEKMSRKKSKFMEHLSRSRVEFLKALRCLVDEKIEDLEKKGTPRGRKKTTRIKVE